MMKINKNTTESKIKTNKQQQDKQTNNKTSKQTNKQKQTLANIYISISRILRYFDQRNCLDTSITRLVQRYILTL
jgi:hypothetical protein